MGNRGKEKEHQREGRRLALSRDDVLRCGLIFAGIAVNVLLSFFMQKLSLLFYLDTVGTILVSFAGGALPGIITAVFSNVAISLFNHQTLYFGIVNVLIAILSAEAAKKKERPSGKNILTFALLAGLMSGVTSSFIKWCLLQSREPAFLAGAYADLAEQGGLLPPLFFLGSYLLINIADKGISLCLALLLLHFFPEGLIQRIRKSGWRQRPLTQEEIGSIRSWVRGVGHSVRSRMAVILTLLTICLVVAFEGISMGFFFDKEKEEKTKTAMNVVKLAAFMIGPDRIGDYLENGRDAAGYAETEEFLYKLRESAAGVEYLYVVQIREDGCYFVFDLDTEEKKGFEPGEKSGFEEAFLPYREALLRGEEIDPIESNDMFGWILTVYHPIRDAGGHCVSYVGADVSLEYMAAFLGSFAVRLGVLLAGFLILILAYEMYAADVRLVYPVSSIALCADELIHSGSDPEKLDENVERIRSLDIRTGDEIEKLYDAIRDLAENQAEQIRSMVSQNQMLQEDEGKLKEQMEIISSIAGIYNSMYELDLDRNTFRELRVGYASVEEVAGKDPSDLQHVIDLMLEKTIHPASIDVDLIGAVDLAFINETLGETGVWTKEVMNPDKKWRRGRIIASKREEDGRISRILWLTEDIDKERKEREQLISDSERAKAASEAKSLFLSNMSHEIRTPINAVLGMNEMILRECDDPDILKYSETIKTAGSTLLGLINDILDISKIEANKMEIIPVEYDLSSLLNDLVCMIRPRAEDKGLVLKLQFDPEIPRLLYGDEVRIKQVITNILTNAVKYTEEGSVTFSIGYEEESAPYGIRLLVSIKDTGIGIKPEDMEKLFSEFERIEEERNRNVEGTGLGMNITQRLLEMMDSKLEVESVYGEGSDFHFALKQMVVKREKLGDYEAAFRASAESQRKYKEKFTAPEARILVADDTEMNLNVFKGLLKRTLVQIETAGSGEEALSLFAAGKFDVIFLDHMMPGMDGIETLHRMRGREGSDPVVPTICLTANAISGAREKYLSEGFEDYLTKPIDANKLEEMLIQYLPKEKVVLTEDGEGSAEGAALDGALPEWLMHCEGVDAAEGVMYCGGTEEYLSVLGDFYDELKRKAEEIEKDYHSGDIRNYTIRVHALKSSARIIGAAGLSEKARLLEEAGDREDLDYIWENTEELLNDYRAFEEILAPVKEAREELPEIPEDMLKDAYAGILEFAGAEDYELVRMVMDSVKEYSLSPEDEARFAAIREKLSQMDWEGIRKEAEGQIS